MSPPPDGAPKPPSPPDYCDEECHRDVLMEVLLLSKSTEQSVREKIMPALFGNGEPGLMERTKTLELDAARAAGENNVRARNWSVFAAIATAFLMLAGEWFLGRFA